MTSYEKALETSRLVPKLKLWETPGFFQFIEDLSQLKGKECDIKGTVEALKKIYTNRMKELAPEGKFIQTKLEI